LKFRTFIREKTLVSEKIQLIHLQNDNITFENKLLSKLLDCFQPVNYIKLFVRYKVMSPQNNDLKQYRILVKFFRNKRSLYSDFKYENLIKES